MNKALLLNKSYPHFVEAKLAEQLTPENRAEFYEKPLREFLESNSFGTVTGGGTLLTPRMFPGEMGIEFVNLDVQLSDLDEALTALRAKLVDLGAPVGSMLAYEDGDQQVESLGNLELLNVFIDNTLDRSFFEAIGFDDLLAKLNGRLEKSNAGKLRSVCQWPRETLIYFGGADADSMYETIKTLTDEVLVLQNARITFQRKDPIRQPIEIRVPFKKN
ncbi:hypothetical protein KF707_20355 [Candidatus Obscuribacterales bacterium]|nr:hypothetical protein [Candidatus Obscuribacterales bacterium]MBX3138593.1 hypothetical protein [Candidatus Obscuribacterales bacterium]MBX3151142.1 hypothetical protein [Candidatus Obscuribacterales bacterium]